MLDELMKLADDYADCRGAEDCGADPIDTDIARETLRQALLKIPAINPAI